MSLVMLAMRICAVEALKGRTLVGGNVLDSEIAPIDVTTDGRLNTHQDAPFIAVYTDGSKSDENGQSGLRSNGTVDLIFSYGVSRAMARTDKKTGDVELLDGIPATDASFEATIDILGVQLLRALVDDDNPWAQLLGKFVLDWKKKEQLRSGSKVEAVRIAAGQMRLSAHTIADPVFGQDLPQGNIWAELLQLAESAKLEQLDLLKSVLGVAPNEGLPKYEHLYAVTAEQAAAMLLYTPQGVPKPTTISSVSVEKA